MVELKKGPWTSEEDKRLSAYIQEHGHGSWKTLPEKAGLKRCGKSCRLRWNNYLRPDIKRGKFSVHEDQTIIQLHALLGNRWSVIASYLPKRTDNEIKNYWNSHLKKRLQKMGFDPVTHKPRADAFGCGNSYSNKNTAILRHTAQWESTRLQAEARLVRDNSKQLLTNDRPIKCLDILKAWQEIVCGSRAGDCSFQSPPIIGFHENSNNYKSSGDACEGGILTREINCIDQEMNQIVQIKEMLSTDGIDSNAWFMEAENNINIVERFSCDLESSFNVGKNVNGSCSSIVDEEDKNYWNSLCNLVSPSYSSFEF